MKHWVSDEFQQNPEISHFWILLRRAQPNSGPHHDKSPAESWSLLLLWRSLVVDGGRSERRVPESGPAPPAAEEKPPVGCLVSNLQVNNHQAASQPLQEKSSVKELKKKKSLSEIWQQLKPNTPLYKAEELQRSNIHSKKKTLAVS